MRESFDKQLAELNCKMMTMASLIEEIIATSVKSLEELNLSLAQKTVEQDTKINDIEHDIERMCLSVLLQYQPVFANDLRRVSAALKMITDMERIGDQAADIAQITMQFINKKIPCELGVISQMAREAAGMVSLSIDAYINGNSVLAESVIASDDKIDNMFIKEKQRLVDDISKNKNCGEEAIDKLMIAKYFERIGDHAVNIAEWVLFSITGERKKAQLM